MIEHHLGVMLTSPDLTDLSSLKHMIDDASDDLEDIFNAIEHAVDQKSTNLPGARKVKDVNWRAKLILAELRAWADTKHSKEEKVVEFQEMLDGLKAKRMHRETLESQFMHRLYKELTSLNGMAEKTISRQLLRRKQLLDIQ